MNNLARKTYYLLPPSIRLLSRRIIFFPADVLDRLMGRRDPLTPPRGLIYTGSGDFRKQGREILNDLINYCGIAPQQRILDVGSGIGRTAVALTTFLSPAGSYEGFDVVKTGVRWCQHNISSKFPHFNFQYTPLGNDLYRRTGTDAATFRFPYQESEFDCAAVVSVFTHMLPPEVENYLGELRRVLKPEGKVYATFFILNDVSLAGMKARSHFSFPYDYGHYRLMDEKVKAANVAYHESYLRQVLQACGFTVNHFFPGYWSGRPKENSHSFQDILVLEKMKG